MPTAGANSRTCTPPPPPPSSLRISSGTVVLDYRMTGVRLNWTKVTESWPFWPFSHCLPVELWTVTQLDASRLLHMHNKPSWSDPVAGVMRKACGLSTLEICVYVRVCILVNNSSTYAYSNTHLSHAVVCVCVCNSALNIESSDLFCF